MGKKKSVVLMTLLTIVIVVLTALTVFPAFPIPGTVKKWNPAILQYDLGSDLGGGYYTYYYPEGVISEMEYENTLNALEGEEKTEFEESYLQCGSLYLDKDEDKDLVVGDEVSEDFAEAVSSAADEIANRFAEVGYSDFRVSVVDKFAIKIELPASDANATQALSLLVNTGDMTLTKGGVVVDELKGKDAKASDLIKGFSVTTRYKVAYIKMNLTKAGKDMVLDMKDELSTYAEVSSATDSSALTTLDVKIGETTILQILQDYIQDNGEVQVAVVDEYNKTYADMMVALLRSVLNEGGFDVEFKAISTSDVRAYEPIDGEKVLTATYIALAIAIVAICVLSYVKMGRFGVVNTYSILSYLIITGLCFAFITQGVFEITLGSILVFLVGLVLIALLNARVYDYIKAEFMQGKTVESAVKSGYNKTLWNTVDVYALFLLGALALLIGGAGVHTMALQAIICVVSAAFINLLWGRAINYTFLSASKNKYQYFRFVREDDDDEE